MGSQCQQQQCQSADLAALHSGYIRHRQKGEEACDRSKAGHRSYVKQIRAQRRAHKGKGNPKT